MAGTVVIPAFNRPRRLRRAVAGVLAQTHRDFELVVVDDASTGDLSGVRQVVGEAGHRWVALSENRGPAAARNAGVAAAASGEWIAFLDSDDRWLPEKLERQLAWHQAHPEIAISQCEEVWIRNGVRVDKPDRLRQPDTGRIFDRCARHCCISPSSVMLSRELWDRFGGFDERYRVCEDYQLWLRIALDHPVGFVPGGLVEKVGGHPDQISRSFPAMDRLRVLALAELIAAGIPAAERRIAGREIRRKAKILATGAEKRGLPAAGLYRALETWAAAAGGTEGSRPIPDELIAELRVNCFQLAGSY